MPDSEWCGFIEKDMVIQRDADDYWSGHKERYHFNKVIETPEGVFERELCTLNHKLKMIKFEQVDE